MSSMLMDAHQPYRRARYRVPRVPRRKAARIKTGRVIVVLAILLVVGMRAAYGGGRTGTEQVTVQPGETVWSIAAQRYPDEDTRAMVGQIVQLNHLAGDQIHSGERLQVPAR
jgi:hypothetical protein